MNHSLLLTDRGLEHRHRWRPVCLCGWSGRNHRRRRFAEVEYRQHVGVGERAASCRFRQIGPRWQPVTPRRLLPDVLRAG